MGRPRIHASAAARDRAWRNPSDRGTPELQAKRAILAGGEPFVEIDFRNGKPHMGAFRQNVTADLAQTTTPLGRLYCRRLVTPEMFRAGELFANMSHTIFGRRWAKASRMAEWVPGSSPSPVDEDKERRTRSAYEAADHALLKAGAFCWHEVHRVCIDQASPGYETADPKQMPALLDDLRAGLQALAAHWRMYPREAAE